MGALGRIPSKPDARDWRLEDFVAYKATDADIAQAVAELKQTTVGYVNKSWKNPPAGTHWARALALLGGTPPPPPPSGDVVWVDNEPVLDQGAQGTCVGHGWAQFGNTNPVDDHYTHEDALDIYLAATTNDGNPDDPRKPGGGQQGASVRGGAQAMVQKGRLNGYAFAGSIDTVKAWVRSKGPVVFGTDWLTGMDNPDGNGLIHATGTYRGGHCYTVLADVGGLAKILNSWGAGWGKQGYAYISWADLGSLLNSGGEACTAVELA